MPLGGNTPRSQRQAIVSLSLIHTCVQLGLMEPGCRQGGHVKVLQGCRPPRPGVLASLDPAGSPGTLPRTSRGGKEQDDGSGGRFGVGPGMAHICSGQPGGQNSGFQPHLTGGVYKV